VYKAGFDGLKWRNNLPSNNLSNNLSVYEGLKGANTLGAVAGRQAGAVRLNWTLKSLLNKQNCVHESTMPVKCQDIF